MIERLSLNLLKLREWKMGPECGCIMSGLIIMPSKYDLQLIERGENIMYQTTMHTLMEAFPAFESLQNIVEYLKTLESLGLIVLEIETFNINYMFTEKGSTWLVYQRNIKESTNV